MAFISKLRKKRADLMANNMMKKKKDRFSGLKILGSRKKAKILNLMMRML
jgi:hypothetical protein